MFEMTDILRTASAMATHAMQRQNLVAQNVAHANTPGYNAVDLAPFADAMQQADTASPMRATRSGHMRPADAGSGTFTQIVDTAEPSPNGNTVSLERELMKSVDVKRQHDLALTIYKTSLNILRSSLGKGA